MTLPPERIGDKGQPYVVQADNWPKEGEGWQNCVYASTPEGAHKARKALMLNPSVRAVRVIYRGHACAR